MEGGVERRLRSVLTGDLCEPKADLLQRERIVTQERPVSFDERGRRLWGLVIATDRRCLPSADLPSVMQLDVDDVFPVPCLARDHERLRQVKANGTSLDPHARRLLRRDLVHATSRPRLVNTARPPRPWPGLALLPGLSELARGHSSRYDTCGLSCRLATACPLLPPGTDAGRFGVSVVPVTDNAARRTIGDILLAHGFVSEESLAEAVAEQERSAQPLGQILVARGVITRLELASALAEQWSDPSASITSLSRSTPVGAPAGQPHDDAQYAARLQDAVADLARRVQANQPLEGIDERIAELSQRIEATLARTQRIEATVATLAESLEGVTEGVEEAFGAVQAGTVELTGELTRIDEAVADLAARPVEPQATDPAVWERLDELRGTVGELAERPVADDAARGRIDELAARLEAVAEATDLDELRSALRELEARPSADPELAARLDLVETVAAGSVGREEVEAQATILADLLATLTALESEPRGNEEIDARLGRIETSLSAVASAVDVEALAARVDETASAQSGLGASLESLSDRIEELAVLQALQADAATRLDGLEERLAAEAASIVGLRDTLTASSERADDGRRALALAVEGLQEQIGQLTEAADHSQSLGLTVEGLQEQLTVLKQTPSSDPHVLERIEALAEQVGQLTEAADHSQSLGLTVEGLQEQLTVLQQTPSRTSPCWSGSRHSPSRSAS